MNMLLTDKQPFIEVGHCDSFTQQYNGKGLQFDTRFRNTFYEITLEKFTLIKRNYKYATLYL